MPQRVSVGTLTDLVVRIFLRHGVSAENAGPVAETIVSAERDGAASHGLLRLPGYVSTLQSGWVDGRALPVVTDAAPALVATEAANGFAQPALRASATLLRARRTIRVLPRSRSAIRTTSPPSGRISSRLRRKGSSRWLW